MSNEIFKCYFCHKDFTGIDARVHFENYVHDQEQAIQERVRREALTMHEVWGREQTAKIEELTMLAGEIPDLGDNRDYWRSKATKLQLSLDAIPSTQDLIWTCGRCQGIGGHEEGCTGDKEEPTPQPSSEYVKAVEALKWAKGYIDDGTVENDTETPQHHCDYIHNPESGHCEFHQKYSEMCEIIAAYRAQVTKEGGK